MNATLIGIASLALVAGAVVLWIRAARAVRLPASRSGYVAAWLGGAALGAVALATGPGLLGGIAAGLALVAGTLLSALVAISRQEAAPDAIAVGEPLRRFTAADDAGHSYELAPNDGRPLLLKFFRGHW